MRLTEELVRLKEPSAVVEQILGSADACIS